MSLVRILPAWLHAVADYAVALALIAVALVAGGPGKVVGVGVIVGLVVLLVSMLTRYPLGVVKIIPFPVHSAGDYLAAALLIVSPFALGFSSTHAAMTAFYIVVGVAVVGVSVITNYQFAPSAAVAPAASGYAASAMPATVRSDRPLRAGGR